MPYNRGHDLASSAPNAKITSGQKTPILPRLKLYFAIWVSYMKAHIVPHHLPRTKVLRVCITQRTTLLTVYELVYVYVSKRFGRHFVLTAYNCATIVL